jgi:hypothetical protein
MTVERASKNYAHNPKLLPWAYESPEPAHHIHPALIDQDRHRLPHSVSGEPRFLHERNLTGQFSPGRIGPVIHARTQIVRKLDMLRHIGTIKLHKRSR